MSDREDLLRAIAAKPDEDTPRLMFADHLEENGEPERAQFIRLKCATAHWPEGSDEERTIRKQIGTIPMLEQLLRQWINEDKRFLKASWKARWDERHPGEKFRGTVEIDQRPHYDRGFTKRCTIKAPDAATLAAFELCYPVMELHVTFNSGNPERWLDQVSALGQCAGLEHLKNLILGNVDQLEGGEWVTRLAKCQNLKGIEHLTIHNLPDEDATNALCAAIRNGDFPGIRSFELSVVPAAYHNRNAVREAIGDWHVIKASLAVPPAPPPSPPPAGTDSTATPANPGAPHTNPGNAAHFTPADPAMIHHGASKA